MYSNLYTSGSQTFPVRGPLRKIWWFTKHKILDLYRDWRTTAANLADHLWSAEQTLGITALHYISPIYMVWYKFIFLICLSGDNCRFSFPYYIQWGSRLPEPDNTRKVKFRLKRPLRVLISRKICPDNETLYSSYK